MAACGGGSEAGDAPLSEAELKSEIQVEAARLNACDAVADCEAKSFDCGSVYVNADSDQTRLDELLHEHESRFGGRGCNASCACGVLRCEENKCVTESSDCMTEPPDGMMVCL